MEDIMNHYENETEPKSQQTLAVSSDAPCSLTSPKTKKKKKRRKKQKTLLLPQDSRLFTIPHDALIPYEKDIKARMFSNTHKGLIDNLQRVFSEEELLHVIDLYRLGSVDHRWMVYPYIDIENRLRMMKTIRYYVDGHRAQSKSGVSSLHALLKEEAILPAQWEEHNCIFGEHLLSINPDKSVVVVESEKTAIVCATLMPSYIWLATGGCDRFRYLETIKEHLNARTTYILPDKGQYNNWCKAARKHKIKGKVLDYIEEMEVERNTDIADLLLSDKREEYLKDFVECLSTDK